MIKVYVIESMSDGPWYTGMSKDTNNCLKEHNTGKNRFTKGHRPWKVIYEKGFPDWAAARVHEKYLKNAAGKNWLKKKLHGGDTSSLPA